MKRSITSFLASGLVSTALAIGVASTPFNAFAQDPSGVKANIPFAFEVGSKVMPAGTYTFTKQGEYIMLLRGSDPHAQILAMVRPQTSQNAPKVGTITFTQYGDRYFLHKVSSSATSTAWDCPTGKQEKELIRELRNQKATEVAVNITPTLQH
ncbi:hypothetical protein [Edaphobacter aggregans]|uniref:hypothetical protein n=1 Tax=Edaphobacter aggregans TaxID=570835 RepID=UPI00054E52AF|nr:hypothetical protein [Edaphobacter aggregans]